MPRSYSLYIADIRDATARIDALLAEMDEAAFRARAPQVDGVLFNLITIGEAAKHIPPAVQALVPGIDWRGIARFRGFVVHHYFGLDMNKVWDIVHTDLPELKRLLAELISLLDADADSGAPHEAR